ncbi:uncharacterized protein LOC116258586 [Nymphaea colorata]|nr:uncharacterized protein LOC116258586 [Nymphaea colorata]
MALLHRLKWKCRVGSVSDPELHQLFLLRRLSSSSSDPNDGNGAGGEGGGQSDSSTKQHSSQLPSSSSLFDDVKSRLRRPSPPREPIASSSSPVEPPDFLFSRRPSRIASLDEIRQNLAEFRRRSAPPPPKGNAGDEKKPPLSFQELYRSSVMGKKAGGEGPGDEQKPARLTLDAIRESLQQIRMSDKERAKEAPEQPLSLRAFRDSLKPQAGEQPLGTKMRIRRVPETLPPSIFGKELGEKAAASESRRTEFVKMYTYGQLGEKLRMLRPEVKLKGRSGFSLVELNDRLRRLREMEEKETQSRTDAVSYADLRDSLLQLRTSQHAEAAKTSMQRLALLGQLGGQVTPSYMLSPPKDDLVEKYFHPDNMSSSEKLKLELQKVREEFKMSESDCGSSRVQVAVLTTKIKHLSSVLHKKDKHSRKGLQSMVGRRKKLLRYLRRTDWESYCLCLSKLGLRDNPDVRANRIVSA